MNEQPHRRYNPLTGEYTLVSPHRLNRPWRGNEEEPKPEHRPQYDPDCFLCPGNNRAIGRQNPAYSSTFIFDNDFSALLPASNREHIVSGRLIKQEAVTGICRVICFSPRHDLSMAEMEKEDIRKVVDIWAEQTKELGEKYRWVQIFENKGDIMGCSNSHPHGQIWASSFLPNEPLKENRMQAQYYQTNSHVLLLDYLMEEQCMNQRIVIKNSYWVALVPFWAVWPFETIVLPKRHVIRLTDLNSQEKDGLADILKRLMTRYDNLFNTSFPYTMGWHGAPFDEDEHDGWQLHAHFYPPLLRSARIKKFLVGYEMLAEAQRDITAEQAAQRLREQSDTHYRLSKDSKADTQKVREVNV